MSIDPVRDFGPANEIASNETQRQARQSEPDPAGQLARKAVAPPDVGTLPKQEHLSTNPSPAAAEFPQDEVEVQQDTQIKDQVIITYREKTTGHVVLQVPSAQVLEVARGIYEEFQKQAEPPDHGTEPRR